ncbi:MAG: polysaccharide biosynthesis tyrosine autokinase [Methylococcales bacterium]
MGNQLMQQSQEFESFDDEEVSFGEILHTLFIRKRLIITVTLLISILAILVIFQLTPRYKASTQLLIGTNSKVVDIQAVLTSDLMGDSAILGEMEVIKSRSLAKKVVESLHLDGVEEFNPVLKEASALAFLNPNTWLSEEFKQSIGLKKVEIEKTEEQKALALLSKMTNAFLSKLKVSQIKRSQVVTLEIESESPQLAAKMANELADKYIIGQLEAKFDATKKATDWLDNQLAKLKEKVENSERAVEVYRQEKGITQSKDNVGLSQQQLSEINSQLIIARAKRAEASARVRQVKRLIRNGGDVSSVSDVLNSSLIQKLKGEESNLQRKYSEMSVSIGKKHPQMIQLKAELSDIKAKIASEMHKIVVSLQNELDIASTRQYSLSSSLKQVQEVTSGDRDAEVGLRALEREASANRALFETFLTRFKETASTQGMDEANARVISEAEVPLGASFPKKKLLLIVSVLGALFFAIVLAFVLEMLNPGLRSPEQVEEHLRLPTLGVIPSADVKQEAHDYVLDKPHSSLTEAINSLRVSLMLLNPDVQVKSLLITSSVPSEGKSTLAMLIARISAQAGQKVVLVDTDFRRPTVEKKLGIDTSQPGLTDLLMQHDLSVSDVLLKDVKTDMKVLSRGMSSYVNPADLFASLRMQQILGELKKDYDLVILDSPPVMAVTDSRVLSRLVDKTLFVLRWDDTPRKVVKAALHQMAQSGADNVAGIILQQVDLKQYGRGAYGDSGYYYHYGKYGQYYVS